MSQLMHGHPVELDTNKSATSFQDLFRRFAHATAKASGSTWAFVAAVLLIVIWALLGPHFHYSDTWQLVINTGTTIVTFLMVFLIQNTQNRDAQAMHLKLDELIRAVHGARNRLIDLEDMSDEELARFQEEFNRAKERANRRRAQRHPSHDQSTAQEQPQDARLRE